MLFNVGVVAIGAYVCVRVIGGTSLGVIFRLHTRQTIRRTQNATA